MFSLLNPYVLGGLALVFIGSNAITAYKVSDYVNDQWELKEAKVEIQIIEKEKIVEVLDKKSLEDALAAQKKRFDQQLQNRKVIEHVITVRENSGNPWCELNDDELRLWNAENSGQLLSDSERASLERRGELSGSVSSSTSGTTGTPVEKQNPNP